MKFNILLFIASALVCAGITFFEIPLLKKLHAGQNIREEGPKEHQKKSGTPTMGGIAYILTLLLLGIFLIFHFNEWNYGKTILFVLLITLAYGLIGFIDDYINVVKHQNEGLSPKQKFLLQALAGLAAGFYRYFAIGSYIVLPFVHTTVNFGWIIIPFTAFVLVAMTNAVNLNDGLDGLCSSVTMNSSLILAIIIVAQNAFLRPNTQSAKLLCVSLAGACVGFLIFNAHPAKLFMGDTGSLAIGAYLTAAAMTCGLDLALPFIGIVYVAEVLSDIIQVAVYKKTGKRVFKMAPLHHHFELCGWSEYKVDLIFVIVTIVFGIIAYLIF